MLAILAFFRNKVLEVKKSMEAVKEHCAGVRLSLDLYYEKIKIEILKSLEDHYNVLSEVIEKTKQEDLEQLENLHGQLNSDLKKLEELLIRGNFVRILSILLALYVVFSYR